MHAGLTLLLALVLFARVEPDSPAGRATQRLLAPLRVVIGVLGVLWAAALVLLLVALTYVFTGSAGCALVAACVLIAPSLQIIGRSAVR